ANLQRHEMWCRSRRFNIGAELPLEYGPRINRTTIRSIDGGHVGDERAPEPDRQGRYEVARLIRVWKENERWRQLRYERGERGHISIGGIVGHGRRVDDDDFGDISSGDFTRRRIGSA